MLTGWKPPLNLIFRRAPVREGWLKNAPTPNSKKVSFFFVCVWLLLLRCFCFRLALLGLARLGFFVCFVFFLPLAFCLAMVRVDVSFIWVEINAPVINPFRTAAPFWGQTT